MLQSSSASNIFGLPTGPLTLPVDRLSRSRQGSLVVPARSSSPRDRDRAGSPSESMSPSSHARRKTVISDHMHSGDDMQQILGHCPSPREHRRRVSSVPARLFKGSDRGSADDDTPDTTSMQSWALSSRSGDVSRAPGSQAPSASNTSIRSPRTPRLWSRAESEFSAPSHVSTRSSLTLATSRSTDSLQIPKLRGDGVDVGKRGVSSAGIPWRQLPTYSSAGAIQATGDVLGSPQARRRELGMTSLGKSVYSPRLGGSAGMRDILATSEENVQQETSPTRSSCPGPVGRLISEPTLPVGRLTSDPALRASVAASSPPVSARAVMAPRDAPGTPLAAQRSPRSEGTPSSNATAAAAAAGLASPKEVWLEMVKRRFQVSTPTAASVDGAVSASTPTVDSRQSPHWTYRQQKGGVMQDFNTKDSCPFAREDSVPEGRPVQSATPHRKNVKSPRPELDGSGLRLVGAGGWHEDPHLYKAEKKSAARRDNLSQQVRDIALEVSALQSPASVSRSLMSDLESQRPKTARSPRKSLTSLNQSFAGPSVKAKPAAAAAQRPRWRG